MQQDPRLRPVVIVGGGPVGMVLALDLALRGVRSVLINTEEYSRWYPKGNGHNTRTMEHYRRLGLAHRIRSVGLRPDQPTDVTYFTRIAGDRLARIAMPSSLEAMAAAARAPVTDQVPEPLHRGNQMYVERVLYDAILGTENVDARFGWRCVDVAEHPDRVTAVLEQVSTGRSELVESAYLVGCDGGRSMVREAIGAVLEGEGEFGTAFMQGPMLTAHVRIPAFTDLVDRLGWMHFVVNPELRATFASLNGDDEFTFRTNRLTETTTDTDIVRLAQLGLGRPVDVEVLSRGEWTAAQALVADSYGTDRIFLCGDSCHLFTPTGGFGMNTGIDDAANLAWKLAAMVEGWGGPRLLDSYQTERKPIGHRNTAAARLLTQSLAAVPVPDELEEDSPAGRRARQRLGAVLGGFDQEFASLGVQLGARYDGSPVIVPDGTEPPPDDPHVYTPSACPGGRAPHVWLPDRSSIFDHFGRGFTLVRFGGTDEIGGLVECPSTRGWPLDTLSIDVPEARELYGADYVLVRPDHHVAWRGDRLPDDLTKVLATVTGQ
jgi:2-polyprenyl-6-methoxyphenol hydroxylase-like FAD-dependent oxidoreductase